MSTDERPLSARVADILATENCIVTPLLREAMGEIERLKAKVVLAEQQFIDFADGFGDDLAYFKGELETSKDYIEELDAQNHNLHRELADRDAQIRQLNSYPADAEKREASLEEEASRRFTELASLRADYEMRGTLMRQMEEYIDGFRRDLSKTTATLEMFKQAEIERFKGALEDEVRERIAERDSLRRDLELCKADAERYRWLREHLNGSGDAWRVAAFNIRAGEILPAQWDAAIDLARARGEGLE
jgi:chromosome segregation ATPase